VARTVTAQALFVPLRGVWFDAFADGSKFDEWRRLGPRWNERTCLIGRPVVLARGYGWPRLHAHIDAISIRTADTEDRRALFGADTPCIVLHLDAITKLTRDQAR
jgi:hypothetical protein